MELRCILLRVLLVLLLLNQFIGHSQNLQDSLKKLILTEKNDSVKAELYLKLSKSYKDPDKVNKYAQIAYNIAIQSKIITTAAHALNEIGTAYYYKSNYHMAINYWERSNLLLEQRKRKVSLMEYSNIAVAETQLGNYSKAIDVLYKTLKLAKRQKDYKMIIQLHSSIAKILGDLGEFQQSNLNYRYAIKINDSLGYSKETLSTVYNNLGYNYMKIKALDSSEIFFNLSLEILRKFPYPALEANIYNNLAEIAFTRKESDKERMLIDKSLEIRRKINDKNGIIYSLRYLGVMYEKQNKINKAIEQFTEAFSLANELDVLTQKSRIARKLSELYKKAHDTEKEYMYYREYVSARDSLKMNEARKNLNSNKTKYEYEMRIFADSLKYEHNKRISELELYHHKSELSNERKTKYIVTIGLVLVIVLMLVLVNRFLITKRQNALIESQKKELQESNMKLEEKQKEILDSIRYAKRIQQTLMPSEKLINILINKRDKRG